MEAELQRALKVRGTLYKDVDPAALAQLAAIAQQHGMAAKQAAAAFDKFMTVHRMDSTAVSSADVEAFRSEYGRGGTKPQTLASARTSNLFNRVSLDDMVLADVGPSEGGEDGSSAGQAAQAPSQRITPYMSKVAARPVSATKPHTPATAGKFAERQNAGSVVTGLNQHLDVAAAAAAAAGSGGAEAMDIDGSAAAAADQQQQRCEVEVLGQPLPANVKYMVDRLEDKVAYLEGRIVALEQEAERVLGLEPHPTAVAAQDAALFVGRICCDAEDGRLNAQSLLLEGSIRTSQGSRVRLDVSRCAAYRLFPGQVVAVRGTNPSGHCIVAAEVLPGLPAPLPRSSLQQLAGYAAATGRAGQSMVVAAGPFTSSEDLEYAPLAALLDYCAQPQHRPDVLLLLGPFVDEAHPLVRDGLLDETFEAVYATRVLSQIQRFTAQVGGHTRVLLVPSTRDVHHHPVFPQPPLDKAEAAAAGSMALANPATLRCNEVVLGATSADWLMACTREEVAQRASGQQEDRLPALASHLPAQRSFFPLFPPPLDLPLDCSKAATALQMMPCTPDLLVLPSELAPFAKLFPVQQPAPAAAAAQQADGGNEGGAAEGQVAAAAAAAAPTLLGSTVCVNPGRLTKGASGGTFAHIHILPLQEALDVAAGAAPSTNAPVGHQLDRRCRVEIKRI